MEIIEKLGTDRALDLLLKAVERQAEIVERELTRSVEEIVDPLGKGLEVYSRFMGDLGAQVKVQTGGEEENVVRVGWCPIYEAFLDIGLECGFWMEGLCTHIVLPSIEEILRRFDPRLKLMLDRYRASAEEPCLVRLKLEDDK